MSAIYVALIILNALAIVVVGFVFIIPAVIGAAVLTALGISLFWLFTKLV